MVDPNKFASHHLDMQDTQHFSTAPRRKQKEKEEEGEEKKARLIINIMVRVGVDWRHQQSQIIETNDGAPWSSANYRISPLPRRCKKF